MFRVCALDHLGGEMKKQVVITDLEKRTEHHVRQYDEWIGTAMFLPAGPYKKEYYDIDYRAMPNPNQYSFSVPAPQIERAKNTDKAIEQACLDDYDRHSLRAKQAVLTERKRSWIHSFTGVERPGVK